MAHASPLVPASPFIDISILGENPSATKIDLHLSFQTHFVQVSNPFLFISEEVSSSNPTSSISTGEGDHLCAEGGVSQALLSHLQGNDARICEEPDYPAADVASLSFLLPSSFFQQQTTLPPLNVTRSSQLNSIPILNPSNLPYYHFLSPTSYR
jgi:hypothetical protein